MRSFDPAVFLGGRKLDDDEAEAVWYSCNMRAVRPVCQYGTDVLPLSRREDEEEETVSEELSDKQKKLDLDDDGKIEPEDLKGLRAGKEDEDVGEEKEEKNEGKLPPWLEKKEGKEDDDKEVVEEDDDDEKNESLDTKDWWDNSLYERLTKKWTK